MDGRRWAQVPEISDRTNDVLATVLEPGVDMQTSRDRLHVDRSVLESAAAIEFAFGGRLTVSLIRRATVLGLAASWALLPTAALAKLGGTVSSVAADRGRMGARMNSFAMSHYTRHELVRPNGGMVREFTNADGVVFAVTWSGPGKPDLGTLLGRYFTTFQANSIATGRRMHSLRHPPQIAQPDLQIQVGGHMGWFHGVAFIPSLAPEGFSLSELSEQQ